MVMPTSITYILQVYFPPLDPANSAVVRFH